MKNTFIWICFTIIATLIMFCAFFNYKFITNFQTNFQSAKSEDAIKDFYTTYYHVKYDTCVLKNNAMNYPYGENIQYTGCQYHISIPLKVLKNFGFNNTENFVIPLINLWVIVSIFLCSIFLFLIFRELKICNIISCLSAISITFLSPQFSRIGSHITLSYMFIVPLMIYLLLIHYRKQKISISIILGLFMFFCGIIHPYYLVFYVALVHFYWLHIIFKERQKFGEYKNIFLQYLIQFLIPFVLYIILSLILSDDADRTKLPLGYFFYYARFEGLIFPFGRDYFYEKLQGIKYIEWESRSYLGIIGVITLLGIFISFIIKLVRSKFKKLFLFSDNTMLNVFFICSTILFLYATCVPLQWFPEQILNYIGPLNQFRSMGRFLWLPFFIINICAVYFIYTFCKKQKKWVSYLIFTLCFALFFIEDYYNLKNLKYDVVNANAKIIDYDNQLKDNQWIKKINIKNFQAILPFPYFNIGSDNYDISPTDNIFNNSVYVSIKTGLPLLANHSARASISRAYKGRQLILDPYSVFPILADLHNNKNILVICKHNSDSLSNNEKQFLNYSDFLFTANNIDFYELKINAILDLISNYQKTIKNDFGKNKQYEITKNVYSNDSIANFYFQSFENLNSDIAFFGKGALIKDVSKKNIIFDSIIPIKYKDKIEISFWTSDITKDIYGRTRFTIELTDNQNNVIKIGPKYITNNLVEINGEWSLFRYIIEIQENIKNIKIYTENNQILKNDIYFDNLLIRPLDNINVVAVDTLKNIYLFNNLIVEKKK